MNDAHWQLLLDTIAGKPHQRIPVGFIIDSPWLPGWYGISILDYFTNDRLWFEANKKAIETFPDILFLPGFWAEYGMCTEPSAFGAKCCFPQNALPHADTVIRRMEDIDRLTVPDPRQHGLAPFVLNRLRLNRKHIEKMGHKIRFAVARGPLNIASFLMGATEFLMALRTDTEKIHKLLGIITEYTVKWLHLQKREFDTIEGILILDDIVGFCGQPDFREFAAPCLKDVFGCLDVPVKFFHNDADGKPCAPLLADVGINMFNFSFLHPLEEMKGWTCNRITLLGNIPPRDVLAAGTVEQVQEGVKAMLAPLKDTTRVIASCGGGMPGEVSTENITAFLNTVQNHG